MSNPLNIRWQRDRHQAQAVTAKHSKGHCSTTELSSITYKFNVSGQHEAVDQCRFEAEDAERSYEGSSNTFGAVVMLNNWIKYTICESLKKTTYVDIMWQNIRSIQNCVPYSREHRNLSKSLKKY
jgi:hypothetical protein